MGELGEAEVQIRAVTDKLDADLAGARGKVTQAMGRIEDSMKAIGGLALGGAIAGVGALAAGLAFATNAAIENEKIQASLSQAIKASGGAAGITAEMANEMAQSFVDLAGGSDDAVLAIETIGIRAGTIAADEMPAFIQASLDLGTVMGDTAGAAELLARAQDDPIAAFKRIEKTTATYDSALEEQIKKLQDAGDTGGAMALIMDKLAETTGGAAAAAAGTMAGQWAILQGRLGEAAETVGMAMLPVLHDLFENVIAPAIPVVEAFAGVLGELISGGDPFKGAMAGMGMAISEAFGPEMNQKIMPAMADLVTFLQKDLPAAIQSVIGKVNEVVEQVKPYLAMAAEWLAQNVKLQDVLLALGAAIGVVIVSAIVPLIAAAAPIVATFIGLVAVVALLRKAWEEDFGGIQEKTAAAWAVIQPLLLQAKEWLEVNIPLALEALKAFWVANWPVIQATVQDVMAKVEEVITTVLPKVFEVVQSVLTGIQVFWAAHGESIISIVQSVLEWLVPAIGTALHNTQVVIETVLAAIQVFWDAWGETIVKVVSNMVENFGFVIDAFAHAFKGDWRAFGEDIRKIWENAWENIKLLLTNAIDVIKTIDWPGIGRAIIDGIAGGITGAAGLLADAARAAAAAAFEAAKGFLGIDSPSKLFEGMGENMMKGLAGGIKGNATLAASAMIGALSAPAFDLDHMLPAMHLVGEDGGSVGNTHYNPVTTIYAGGQDPMRVLRAARHLDKLGALA